MHVLCINPDRRLRRLVCYPKAPHRKTKKNGATVLSPRAAAGLTSLSSTCTDTTKVRVLVLLSLVEYGRT